MAYENVQAKYQNFTGQDGYFYTFDSGQDNLVVKTDDGNVAFTYPLDTLVTNEIVSTEYDGYNFWTLENPSGSVIIRRWQIQNYVCTLQHTFDDLVDDADWTFDSEALAIEHYYLQFTAPEAAGPTNNIISVGDVNGVLTDVSDKVDAGMNVRLGPNSSGETEDFGVVSAGPGTITLNGVLTKSYASTDPVYVYTKIWLFNNDGGPGTSDPALIGYDPYGNVQPNQETDLDVGAEYADIPACTFSYVPEGLQDITGSDIQVYSLTYVKSSNLLFKNVEDPTAADYLTNYGSMAMDNLEDDDITIIKVYDMFIYNRNVYRLQRKATYYGSTYTFSDSAFSYQLATLTPFVHSISLQADPAVIPADSGVSSSVITAVVKSQFLNAISSRRVDFTQDGDGSLSTSWDITDADGVANTTYFSGSTAREVKVTATAKQS
jgi:hypothetical protein